MNKLSTERRAQVLGCLVEGMSIRATVRVTGAAKNTVSKLLVDLGRDVWAWVAIDADTKLIPTWLVGERTVEDAYVFISDISPVYGIGCS